MAASPNIDDTSADATTGMLSSTPPSSSRSGLESLPEPRSKPLKAYGAKEDLVRRYVEQEFAKMSRRWVKRCAGPDPEASTDSDPGIVGYASFKEVCKDLGGIIDVVWKSGTPSLQIPILLNAAGQFNSYAASFPPSPAASFAVLRKLDHCFSSLILGKDCDTSHALPGFENGLRAGLSTTDMVRCMSIAEQTRPLMAELLSKGPEDREDDEDGGDDAVEDDEDEDDGVASQAPSAADSGVELRDRDDVSNDADADGSGEEEEDEDDWTQFAKIYEHTIVLINERLGEGLETTTAAPANLSCA